MKTLLAALLLTPALAVAQPADPTTADGWYTRGEDHYNVGEFEKAIDAFKRGFSLEPTQSKKAAYLYNIAQAYRVQKDCTNASFFYKRFLEFKDADAKKPLAPEKRKEIEAWIAELEECKRTQTSISQRPPDSLTQELGGGADTKPADTTVGTGPTGSAESTDPTEGEVDELPDEPIAPGGRPTKISARLLGGVAILSAGDLDAGARVSGGLIAGYPIPVGKALSIEVGAAFQYASLSVMDTVSGGDTTLNLLGALANVGLTYHVNSKLGIRADVGVGVLALTGASQTEVTGGAETTGTLAMLKVRAGVSADYAITPNIVATLAPFAFSYSPAKSGLREDIDAFTSIDVMLGVGYRM